MNPLKSPAEYAALLLEFTGGNKLEAVKVLLEAKDNYKLPHIYVSDIFNIITGN